MLVHAELLRTAQLVEGQDGPVVRTLWGGGPAPTHLPNRLAITHSYYAGTLAGSLAVPTIGSFDASAEVITIVQDVYRGVRIVGATTGLAEVHGASVRLAVSFRTANVEGKTAERGLASLAGVAASVEAGSTTASYRFELIGLTDTTPIADLVPLVGSFDAAAYLALTKATNDVVRMLLRTPAADLSIEPLFVEFDEMRATNPFDAAAEGWIRGLVDVVDDRVDFVGANEIDRAAFQNAVATAARKADRTAWANQRLRELRSLIDERS